MTYIQSTRQIFLIYTGDYIRLLLYVDIVQGFSSLTFGDISDIEFSIYDMDNVLRLRKNTGRILNEGSLIYNDNQVVVNTSSEFESDSANSAISVILNEGDTAWFFPGVYTLKLSVTFENNRVFTYSYKDALHVLQH